MNLTGKGARYYGMVLMKYQVNASAFGRKGRFCYQVLAFTIKPCFANLRQGRFCLRTYPVCMTNDPVMQHFFGHITESKKHQ